MCGLPRSAGDTGTRGTTGVRIRRRRELASPVVRRYTTQTEFDSDRMPMAARGLHVASVGSDPTGGLRVVWSSHRRYSIERRDQREPV